MNGGVLEGCVREEGADMDEHVMRDVNWSTPISTVRTSAQH